MRLHVVLTELYIAHIVCVVDFAGKKPLQKWLWLDGSGWEGGMGKDLDKEWVSKVFIQSCFETVCLNVLLK